MSKYKESREYLGRVCSLICPESLSLVKFY